ncbi:MAG TPA: hypothetical protein DCG71_12075, partial [Brevundimonas sp.]|nr:hypothetical protein [Brevundimonas sp.]
IGQRPPVAARVPARRHAERNVLAVVKPRPPVTEASTPAMRTKSSGRKRKAMPLAEGQLGFDF